MTREEIINQLQDARDGYKEYLTDEALNMAIKVLEQEPILDKLKAEITTLQNRCYALTKGTMYSFCKYECEYKAEKEADNGNVNN